MKAGFVPSRNYESSEELQPPRSLNTKTSMGSSPYKKPVPTRTSVLLLPFLSLKMLWL